MSVGSLTIAIIQLFFEAVRQIDVVEERFFKHDVDPELVMKAEGTPVNRKHDLMRSA